MDYDVPTLHSLDNEYIAEEYLVTVTSNINHSQFRFISGVYGPLEANFPTKLPLWLAITLTKKGKCRIHPPAWMTVESLEDQIVKEKVETTLQPIPANYMEIAHLMLTHAKEDFNMPDKIAVLLRDLESVRLDRLKIGIQGLTDDVKGGSKVIVVHISNISSMEIFSVKDFIIESLSHFRNFTAFSNDVRTSWATDSPLEFEAENTNTMESRRLRRFRN